MLYSCVGMSLRCFVQLHKRTAGNPYVVGALPDALPWLSKDGIHLAELQTIPSTRHR